MGNEENIGTDLNFDDSENLNTKSDFTYIADRNIDFGFFLKKVAMFFGVYLIIMASINLIWYLFYDKLIFSLPNSLLFCVMLFVLKILWGERSCPAYSVLLDETKRTVTLKYIYLFFIKRTHKSNLNFLKIEFKTDKSAGFSQVTFFTRSMSEICYVDKNEALFSDVNFKGICRKLDGITISKNI